MTAFGLGVLRLSPEAFWRATPAEIAAAARGLSIGGPATLTPLGRRELDALMARFPDQKAPDQKAPDLEAGHGRG